eukprot:403350890
MSDDQQQQYLQELALSQIEQVNRNSSSSSHNDKQQSQFYLERQVNPEEEFDYLNSLGMTHQVKQEFSQKMPNNQQRKNQVFQTQHHSSNVQNVRNQVLDLSLKLRKDPQEIPRQDQEILQQFLKKLQKPSDIQALTQQIQKVYIHKLTQKNKQLTEQLYQYFKNSIETLYGQLEVQEWNNRQSIQYENQVLQNSLLQTFDSVQQGDQDQAKNNLSELNQYLMQRQKTIDGLLDDIYLKMKNAVTYSIESISNQVIRESTFQQYFMREEQRDQEIKVQALEKLNLYKATIDKVSSHEECGQSASQHFMYNVKRTNSKAHMKKAQNVVKLESLDVERVKEELIKVENGQAKKSEINVSKEDIKIIKREEDLKRTFNLSSNEMEYFSNFEQAEQFIEQKVLNKTNFIVLASSLKKVQQIFILKKDLGVPKVHEVHMINQESVVQFHVTNISPHYLVITMALFVTTVRARIIFVDCQTGEIILKKEIISPNPSQFKCYYQDPYFCILYGRAKLILIDFTRIIQGYQEDFHELQTTLNFKSNYKIQIQPLMGQGPTDLLGFHYSSQERVNQIFQFGLSSITDPQELKIWLAQQDKIIEYEIQSAGKLMVVDLRKTEIERNEIPNKTYNYGTIALSPERILIIGGISEQQGTPRDQCYVYDLKTRHIDKCAELYLKMKDAFTNENYSYYEDEFQYVVAGRCYLHLLDKAKMQWELVEAYIQTPKFQVDQAIYNQDLL